MVRMLLRVVGIASPTIVLGAVALSTLAFAAEAPWVADLGDGRYRNPILHADYSDPDVTRVGPDFYLVSSSFTNTPGLPILHSLDLVNWRIVGHALSQLVPIHHHATPRRGGGVWAPAICHRNGRFRIYYPDPDFGVFVVTAEDPAGPWSEPTLVTAARGAIDPAPFWDEDGRAYLVVAWARSRAGFNNVLTLFPMDVDGDHVTGEGTVIVDGHGLGGTATSMGPTPWSTIEGPKLYKRDGYYYIFAPAGGVKQGWQAVFRSRRLTGPYEARNVMDQGGTEVNGPHQGAWVTTGGGEDWFVHFQDMDSYGRVVHLQPMTWKDDWPVIGADPDGDGRGEPVATYRKPRVGHAPRVSAPQTGDDFGGAALALGWQWQANPRADWASLTHRPGHLRLTSVSVSGDLYEAPNLLTQKLPGPAFTATTLLEFAPKAEGEQAGLVVLGADYGWIGLRKSAAGVQLVQGVRQGPPSGAERVASSLDFAGERVFLRVVVEPAVVSREPLAADPQGPSRPSERHANCRFDYSLDGRTFVPFGAPFMSRPGRWVGAQIGLFAMAPSGTPSFIATTVGHADFDFLELTR